MPPNRLCLCLTGKTLTQNLEIIKRYRSFIDLLELRADCLSTGEHAQLARFPSLTDLPVILSLRRTTDGGFFQPHEEPLRQQLLIKTFSSSSPVPFAYLDMEEDLQCDELEQLARSRGTRIIRSFHDFESVPADLSQRIKALWHQPTDIVKAAVKPRNTTDLARLVEVTQELQHNPELAARDKIIVGMDIFGIPSRILAPRLGSFLTYSSPGQEQQAAPGHLDPITLHNVYRYHELNSETSIFAIIGNPVMHSFSPHIHNHGFSALGLNAVYVPFPVDDVEAFFHLAGLLPVQAASVTIPHKKTVTGQLAMIDDGIRATGACNTIKQTGDDSSWQGINTDIDGFITPLHLHWGGRIPDGMKATVLGAGGSARAVVYALTRAGIKVLVLNRTESRAEELARSFGCDWGGLDSESVQKAYMYNDIIVQTTSVGMRPHTDADPFPEYSFLGHEVVYDIIYRPPLTRFLARARQAGCPLVYGIDMLIQQALFQFRYFTGKTYPDPEKIKNFLPD